MGSSVEMWLWLLLVMQPHNPKTHDILRSCGYDIRRACIQVRDGAFPFLAHGEIKRARDVRMKQVSALQSRCAENNIGIIPFDHADYPEKLRFIENPPIVLFVRGDLRCLKNRRIISAVGTRNPSEYSLRTAEALCASIAGTGAVVVSGLAVGLDTAAHRGALKAKGVTVGVLACGHLVDYPAESHGLKEDIVHGGGAVISELLPEENVPRGYFYTRNRLISGIADATVVLEAAARSGALLTAAHAFEQRRKVFFIPPHDIFDPRYAGAAGLYKEGAAPAFGCGDILNAFTLTGEAENGALPSENTAPSPKPARHTASGQKSAKTKQTADPVKPKASPESEKAIPEGLGKDETAVYKALMKEPLDVDLLVVRTEIYYRTIMEILMEMEVSGLVERNADGTYSLL